MKIFCVGRNYLLHATELGNKLSDEPIIFLKPDTALLLKNRPFYHPAFTANIHYEVEIVVKICRIGKNIEERFANRYYKEIGLGIDFTARDIQSKLKEQGLPWEKAKSFDYSTPLSKFYPKTNFPNINNLDFSLEKNQKIVQQDNTRNMIFSIDYLIAYISKYFTFKIGDLLYTGTPHGVGQVHVGDRLVGKIENKTLLDFEIK